MRLPSVARPFFALLIAACGTAAEGGSDAGSNPGDGDAGQQSSGWTSPCGDLKSCSLACDTNATAATVCSALDSKGTVPAPRVHFPFDGFLATDPQTGPCTGAVGAANCAVVDGNVMPGGGVYDNGAFTGRTIRLGGPGGPGPEVPPGHVRADGTGATKLTVAAWIRPETNTGDRMIVSEGRDFPAHLGWMLTINSSGVPSFLVGGGSTDTLRAVSGGAACEDKWTHVAGTFGDGLLKLYVNGALVDDKALDLQAVSLGTEPLTIAKRFATTPYGIYYGDLDDVVVWDSVLSAADIQLAYERGFCRRALR